VSSTDALVDNHETPTVASAAQVGQNARNRLTTPRVYESSRCSNASNTTTSTTAVTMTGSEQNRLRADQAGSCDRHEHRQLSDESRTRKRERDRHHRRDASGG